MYKYLVSQICLLLRLLLPELKFMLYVDEKLCKNFVEFLVTLSTLMTP